MEFSFFLYFLTLYIIAQYSPEESIMVELFWCYRYGLLHSIRLKQHRQNICVLF